MGLRKQFDYPISLFKNNTRDILKLSNKSNQSFYFIYIHVGKHRTHTHAVEPYSVDGGTRSTRQACTEPGGKSGSTSESLSLENSSSARTAAP